MREILFKAKEKNTSEWVYGTDIGKDVFNVATTKPTPLDGTVELNFKDFIISVDISKDDTSADIERKIKKAVEEHEAES